MARFSLCTALTILFVLYLGEPGKSVESLESWSVVGAMSETTDWEEARSLPSGNTKRKAFRSLRLQAALTAVTGISQHAVN